MQIRADTLPMESLMSTIDQANVRIFIANTDAGTGFRLRPHRNNHRSISIVRIPVNRPILHPEALKEDALVFV